MTRENRNINLFICLFFSTGFVSGVCLDIIPTFLHSSPDTRILVSYYSVFMGIGAIIGSVMSNKVNSITYKKLMIFCLLLIALPFFLFIFASSNIALSLAVISFSIGLMTFDILAIPFVDIYSTVEQKTSSYTKVYLSNMLGTTLGMLLGGTSVVYKFSKLLGVSYKEAKMLTAEISKLNASVLSQYLHSYNMIFYISIIVLLFGFIPLIFLNERTSDYGVKNINPNNMRFDFSKIVKSKKIIIYIILTAFTSLAYSFVQPFFSIVFSSLGIDRQNVSIVMVINSFIPMLLIYFNSALSKRVGIFKTRGLIQIVVGIFFIFIYLLNKSVDTSINIYIYLTISLILIGNGVYTGLRGINAEILMNISGNELRTQMSAVNYLTMGLSQILGGVIFNRYLFTLESPYLTSYIVVALIFIPCGLVILTNIFCDNCKDNKMLRK